MRIAFILMQNVFYQDTIFFCLAYRLIIASKKFVSMCVYANIAEAPNIFLNQAMHS